MNLEKSAVALLFALSVIAFSSKAFSASPATNDGVAVLTHRDEVKQMRAKNHAFAKTVQMALRHQKGLDSSGIFVFARGSDVVLVGQTSNQDQIDLASTAAQSVVGVKSVKNNVTVEDVGD